MMSVSEMKTKMALSERKTRGMDAALMSTLHEEMKSLKELWKADRQTWTEKIYKLEKQSSCRDKQLERTLLESKDNEIQVLKDALAKQLESAQSEEVKALKAALAKRSESVESGTVTSSESTICSETTQTESRSTMTDKGEHCRELPQGMHCRGFHP